MLTFEFSYGLDHNYEHNCSSERPYLQLAFSGQLTRECLAHTRYTPPPTHCDLNTQENKKSWKIAFQRAIRNCRNSCCSSVPTNQMHVQVYRATPVCNLVLAILAAARGLIFRRILEDARIQWNVWTLALRFYYVVFNLIFGLNNLNNFLGTLVHTNQTNPNTVFGYSRSFFSIAVVSCL